jgi:hypothetical protein
VAHNKKQEAKIETAEMKFLRSVAGYITKGQIRNTKIREELNIFNLNAKIIKSRPEWKYHLQRMEGRRIAKKILTHEPRRTPTVKEVLRGNRYLIIYVMIAQSV